MNLFGSQRFTPAKLVVATILYLFHVAHTKAQMAPTPQPEKVSNRVLQLAAEGKLNEADKVLQEALFQCQKPSAPLNCSFLLTFTQAYLAQEKGAAGAEEARGLYSKIIKDDPSNGPALNNLALVEDSMGNESRAEELWTTAIAKDPGRADHYALLLGDHFLRLNNIDGGLKAYDLAERSAPTAATPRQRVISAYRHTEGIGNLDPLEARANEWEAIDPGAARAAYEFLISRWSSNPSFAQKADNTFVRWGRLLARNDWLDKDSVSFLPAGWKTPGTQELQTYLETPTERPHWNWWRSTPERYGATFEFARAMGRVQLRERADGAKRAESCFQWALDLVTPGSVINSDAAIDGYLQLSQELASLYFDHPELDPNGRRFSEMVDRLYAGKMLAIARGERKITQAYHTTLAYIYVSRGVWQPKPGTAEYMSASYQLQAVLDDASFRERSEGYFQPLPEIKDMLAKAYVERGNKSEAARMSLSAAMAYLDSDAVTESQRLLRQSISLGSTASQIPQLRQIIAARAQPERVTLEGMNSEKLPWLFRPSGPVTDSFLKRQRFKIYADLLKNTQDEQQSSKSVSPVGGLQTASFVVAYQQKLTAALEAYQLVAEQQTNLVGAGDLLRWQRTEAALLTSANGQPVRPRIVVSSDSPIRDGQRTKLPIALAGDDRPSAIAVQRDTPTAVAVLRAVGVSRVQQVRPYIRLGQGQLIVMPGVGSTDANPLIQQLKNDPNLRAVIKSDTAPT